MNRSARPITPELEALTSAILAAAFEVSNTLGHGFLEAVYRKAMVHELRAAQLDVVEEVSFSVPYKGISLGSYVADLVVAKNVIVELKAIERLAPLHIGQVLNYLRASGLRIGLLINFGKPRVEYKRVLL